MSGYEKLIQNVKIILIPRLDAYKNLSALGGSNTWQINQTNEQDLVFYRFPGLVDNKVYNINDVFLQDILVKSTIIDLESKKEDKRNLPDGIIRHQFMNLLVKVTKDRYLTRSKILAFNTLDKQFPNIIEALAFSLDNHYMPIQREYEVHNWRTQRYYNEYTDNILKAYLYYL
jgi:hypothetical protein